MERAVRAKYLEKNETTESKKTYKKEKVKDYQIILMIITLVIAVFVVIQVVHMVNYTLGNEMDINKMWLYKWVLNLGN